MLKARKENDKDYGKGPTNITWTRRHGGFTAGREDGGNAWVKENQDSNISFANVDLGPHRNPPGNYPDVWTFMRFHFPNGRKDFTNTNFGES